MTLIGVRGIPEDSPLDAIDFFELDALDPLLATPKARRKILSQLHSGQKLTLSFGLFFLRGEDALDRRERIRSAAERHSLYGADSSCILAPPSVANSSTFIHSLECFCEEFIQQGLPPPRVDTSFEGALPLERVGDPAWQNSREEYKTKEWRIHGHHPTRWIRLYSDEVLDRLAKAALKYRPERIVFAHSQRFLQARDFGIRLKQDY